MIAQRIRNQIKRAGSETLYWLLDWRFRVQGKKGTIPSSTYVNMKGWNRDVSSLKAILQDCSVETMPQWLNFETTMVCNLKCPHCMTHGTEETREKYNDRSLDMPRETLLKVAEEALPWADEFSLALSGEPMATPKLKEILEVLTPYRAKLDLVTNGTYFSKENLIKVLPVAGKIQISIDGATELTCEAIRAGVQFRRLLKNIRLLTRTLEFLPSERRPKVNFAFTILGSNIRDLPEMVKLAYVLMVPEVNCCFVVVDQFQHVRNERVELYPGLYNAYHQKASALARDLGISLHLPEPFPGVLPDPFVPLRNDGIIVSSLPRQYYETLPPLSSLLDQASIEAEALDVATHLLGQDPRKATASDDPLNPLTRDKKGTAMATFREWSKSKLKKSLQSKGLKFKYCEYLNRRMYVSAGGDVTPCCVLGRPVLGNVHRNSVREIWNGDLYREFRSRFYSPNPFECCKDCIHVRHWPEEGR